jgi:hypothetical protein
LYSIGSHCDHESDGDATMRRFLITLLCGAFYLLWIAGAFVQVGGNAVDIVSAVAANQQLASVQKICETGHIPAGVASPQSLDTGDAGCATARSAACSFDCYLHKQFGVTKFPPPKGCGYHVVPAGIYFKPLGSPTSRKVMKFRRGRGRFDSAAGTVTWTDSATLKSGYVWCSYRQQFFSPGTVTCTPGGPQPWDGLEIAGPQVARVRTISCTTTQSTVKDDSRPPLPRFEGYARKQKRKR